MHTGSGSYIRLNADDVLGEDGWTGPEGTWHRMLQYRFAALARREVTVS